jgi:tRNA(fMet)-specific endonuclease VapC
MILDTNFLISLEREIRRQKPGAASEFLQNITTPDLCITPTIEGEMACGLSLSNRVAWESFIKPFRRLAITREVSWHYGQIYRQLAADGQLIGTNDLWIAAAGLAYSMPIVTRNQDEFKRVPNLGVILF